MKLRKRFAAMCAATVMALGTLGIEASASGSITITNSGNNIVCSISNLNNSGNTSTTMFKGRYSGSHTFTMTVGASNSTYIKLIDPDGYTMVSFTIPAYAPGMPSTVSSSYYLNSSTKYRVKANTPPNGSYSGSITIEGAKTTT